MSTTYVPSRNRLDSIVGISSAFTFVALVVVAMRIFVRTRMVKAFGWDDWTMVATMLTYCLFIAFVILNTYIRESYSHLTIPQYEAMFQYLVASLGLYVATMLLLKISIGFFYLRLIVENWQRKIVYVNVAVSTVWGLFYFCVAVFQCGNPQDFLAHHAEGKCLPTRALLGINITAGIINALTDWVFACLPIFFLRKANMPMATKYSAGGILLLASVGSIISVIRLTYIKGLTNSTDIYSSIHTVAEWSIVEPGIGIIAASLATLRPLFSSLMGTARSMGSGGSTPKETYASHKYISADSKTAQNSKTRTRILYMGREDRELQQDDVELQEVTMHDNESVGALHRTDSQRTLVHPNKTFDANRSSV